MTLGWDQLPPLGSRPCHSLHPGVAMSVWSMSLCSSPGQPDGVRAAPRRAGWGCSGRRAVLGALSMSQAVLGSAQTLARNKPQETL